MNTKPTLRIDDRLTEPAKKHAARRGKSVSQMFGEFVAALSTSRPARVDLPPVTGSLLGIMKNQKLSETDYKNHLRDKHS